ncbi:hypothetical protein Tco_1244314 [Tanacetum coccineum]|uniref:Uncharacterized protein n=1 Tax=Tanacetum coccineum TaxID=301880 RepID=A0ABQ4Z0F8_9ASTR
MSVFRCPSSRTPCSRRPGAAPHAVLARCSGDLSVTAWSGGRAVVIPPVLPDLLSLLTVLGYPSPLPTPDVLPARRTDAFSLSLLFSLVCSYPPWTYWFAWLSSLRLPSLRRPLALLGSSSRYSLARLSLHSSSLERLMRSPLFHRLFLLMFLPPTSALLRDLCSLVVLSSGPPALPLAPARLSGGCSAVSRAARPAERALTLPADAAFWTRLALGHSLSIPLRPTVLLVLGLPSSLFSSSSFAFRLRPRSLVFSCTLHLLPSLLKLFLISFCHCRLCWPRPLGPCSASRCCRFFRYFYRFGSRSSDFFRACVLSPPAYLLLAPLLPFDNLPTCLPPLPPSSLSRFYFVTLASSFPYAPLHSLKLRLTLLMLADCMASLFDALDFSLDQTRHLTSRTFGCLPLSLRLCLLELALYPLSYSGSPGLRALALGALRTRPQVRASRSARGPPLSGSCSPLLPARVSRDLPSTDCSLRSSPSLLYFMATRLGALSRQGGLCTPCPLAVFCVCTSRTRSRFY